jgi:hypothetical protein
MARVSKDGRRRDRGLMVRDAQDALLTMSVSHYATWLRESAAYSGSTSQITRLRPLRLAA